jgi:hypothetical protein
MRSFLLKMKEINYAREVTHLNILKSSLASWSKRRTYQESTERTPSKTKCYTETVDPTRELNEGEGADRHLSTCSSLVGRTPYDSASN